MTLTLFTHTQTQFYSNKTICYAVRLNYRWTLLFRHVEGVLEQWLNLSSPCRNANCPTDCELWLHREQAQALAVSDLVCSGTISYCCMTARGAIWPTVAWNCFVNNEHVKHAVRRPHPAPSFTILVRKIT